MPDNGSARSLEGSEVPEHGSARRVAELVAMACFLMADLHACVGDLVWQATLDSGTRKGGKRPEAEQRMAGAAALGIPGDEADVHGIPNALWLGKQASQSRVQQEDAVGLGYHTFGHDGRAGGLALEELANEKALDPPLRNTADMLQTTADILAVGRRSRPACFPMAVSSKCKVWGVGSDVDPQQSGVAEAASRHLDKETRWRTLL